MIVNENREPLTNGICCTGPIPYVMQGYIRRYICWHFSDPKYIQTPELKQFIWTTDTVIDPVTGIITTKPIIDSKIQIEPLWKYQPNTTQQRPAVIVKRNTLETERLSLGDRLHGTTSLYGDVNPNKHSIVSDIETMFKVNCSISCICIGNNGATVEALGYEVFDTLITYVPIFLKELNLLNFEVHSLEGIGKLEEDKELFALPVTISYSYTMGKIIRSEAPILKGFSYEFNPMPDANIK